MHGSSNIPFYDCECSGQYLNRPRYLMYLKLILITLALIGITADPVRAQDYYSPLAPSSNPTSSVQQFRLKDLTITGNTHTKLYVILRMIPISPGEIFNTSLWEH